MEHLLEVSADGANGLSTFDTGPHSLSLVTDAFPDFRERVCPFGYDWLGRQFVIDSGRSDDGQPLVLLLEPGTAEALEIPVTFVGLHEEELIEYADAALAKEFFSEWAAGHPESVPLKRGSCVGYRQPLFLNGQDIVENFELSDLDVYWTLFGRLRPR